jgi:hypothetical protein
MLYRTITSTQTRPVIWLVRYRQPKRDTSGFTFQPFPEFLARLDHTVAE